MDTIEEGTGMQKRLFSGAQLRRLITPLIVEQLLLMLVGMLDTVMVSSAGEAVISGVSIVNDVNNLIIMLMSALAGGGSVIVSQYLGYNDEEKTRLSASQLVMISFVISTVLGVLCVIFHADILHLLYRSIEADVFNSAKIYFWITALSFPFLGIYNSGTALYRSMNRTKVTMWVSVLMNLINLVGNYICVYRMGMGAAGVAIPTLISRIVASIVMIRLCTVKENPVCITLKEVFSFHKLIVKKILSIAIPNGVENGLFQLGKVIVSTFVATYGTMQIAANGVTNSLSSLCYVTQMAMQLAVVTVIGQCVGAGDYEQAKYYVKKMFIIGYILVIADNLLVFFLSPYALGMYTLTPSTFSIAETILVMDCIAVSALHMPAFVLPCCLRASGDAKYTMYVGVASMFAARVCEAYVLGTVLGYGVVGTRIAMYADWVIRIIFFVYRYFSGKWMNFRLVGKK